MIAAIFHSGSGLGNQLHRYVMARVLALDKRLEFGMIFPENFKGSSFMQLDMGVPVTGLLNEFQEERVYKNGNDVRPYDFRVRLQKDFTLLEGEYQGEKYYEHRLKRIREWLDVAYVDVSTNVCVIGFRGGEYAGVPELFLPQEYWDEAIAMMRNKYPNITFEVHTDDVETAQKFFPTFTCIHDIGLNWRSVRYAKHLIIANSSFYILPALLNEKVKEIIAPRFWAGYNKGIQQLEQNIYSKFTYLDPPNDQY